jgi:RNA polymerase sigma-70 factor (ECF subfamily)
MPKPTDPYLEQMNRRLSDISTLWTLVHRAHGPLPEAGDAQQRLLERYTGAVRRYLLGALKDEDAAQDVFQDFALAFLRGDFQRADRDKGRHPRRPAPR